MPTRLVPIALVIAAVAALGSGALLSTIAPGPDREAVAVDKAWHRFVAARTGLFGELRRGVQVADLQATAAALSRARQALADLAVELRDIDPPLAQYALVSSDWYDAAAKEGSMAGVLTVLKGLGPVENRVRVRAAEVRSRLGLAARVYPT